MIVWCITQDPLARFLHTTIKEAFSFRHRAIGFVSDRKKVNESWQLYQLRLGTVQGNLILVFAIWALLNSSHHVKVFEIYYNILIMPKMFVIIHIYGLRHLFLYVLLLQLKTEAFKTFDVILCNFRFLQLWIAWKCWFFYWRIRIRNCHRRCWHSVGK